MLNTIIFILELIGTVSYAISGSITGIDKKMDIFGITILGVTTAVGGGLIRDIILGKIPPTCFVKPIYILLAVVVSLIFFLKKIRIKLHKHETLFYKFVRWTDTIGLGVFTAVGESVAIQVRGIDNWFLIICVALFTGVGGGLTRDCLANDTPVIFVKDFYATASLLGAIIGLILWNIFGEVVGTIACTISVIILRFFARKYGWHLPTAK